MTANTLFDRLCESLGGPLDPDRSSLEAVLVALEDWPLDRPAVIVNLFRFHNRAKYDEPIEQNGETAFKRYLTASGPVFRRAGVFVLLAGPVASNFIVDDGERWDFVTIAGYPDPMRFLTALADPDYQAALIHREAGVAATKVLITQPLLLGGPPDELAGDARLIQAYLEGVD
ncbi:MAG: DUF1330 domain-containing protein [Pseudomonadota bacterium]